MSRRKLFRKEKSQKVKEPKRVSKEFEKELEVREGPPSPVGNEKREDILGNRDFIDTIGTDWPRQSLYHGSVLQVPWGPQVPKTTPVEVDAAVGINQEEALSTLIAAEYAENENLGTALPFYRLFPNITSTFVWMTEESNVPIYPTSSPKSSPVHTQLEMSELTYTFWSPFQHKKAYGT